MNPYSSFNVCDLDNNDVNFGERAQNWSKKRWRGRVCAVNKRSTCAEGDWALGSIVNTPDLCKGCTRPWPITLKPQVYPKTTYQVLSQKITLCTN